jgi:hypothetical protein
MTMKFPRLQNILDVPAPLMLAVIPAAGLLTKAGYSLWGILSMATVFVAYVLGRFASPGASPHHVRPHTARFAPRNAHGTATTRQVGSNPVFAVESGSTNSAASRPESPAPVGAWASCSEIARPHVTFAPFGATRWLSRIPRTPFSHFATDAPSAASSSIRTPMSPAA